MSETLIEKVQASYDQAVVRGVPASVIVTGIGRKFSVSRERILEILSSGKRIRVAELDGVTVCWALQAMMCQRTMDVEIETTMVQSSINYALSRELCDAATLLRTPVHELKQFVTSLIAGHAAGAHRAA